MLTNEQIDAIFDHDENLVFMLDEAPFLVSIVDSKGYFKKVNDAWTRFLGWTKEELLNRPFRELIHPDDLELTLATYPKEQSFDEQEPEVVGFRNRYLKKDGGYLTLEWYSTGVKSNGLNLAIAITRKYNG